MERNIVHMDLDSFFVSVECLLNPKFIGKPLIIGGTSDRGVVSSCSYEARRFGVHSAMPVRMAKKLCPDALIVRGDYENYTKYSGMVTEIVKESVPVYEKASIDEFYADLSGMERFFSSYKLAIELRQKIIRETGLPISFGLSQNKTVSKVATGEAKPNGQRKVDFGLEKPFLAPLSIKKIPMVGEKTYTLLRSMGVEKVQTLQQMPPEMLQSALGEHGLQIWERANGIDNNPVVPYSERKSVSTECTFEQDTIDVDQLRMKLVSMCEELGFSLRKEEKLCSCITVKIRYSNFDTHTRQMMIPYTAIDEHLIARAKELFDRLYERRMLVRLIGVRVSHLVSGRQQINLFEDTEEKINLYLAMDKINKKYGAQTIRRSC
ncbi:MAG: DNA polymerase IV [Flavobacteriales bacterium]|nr:DNA polymerase IV [Flavobacteriales bacterium]